jgi:hypothetical protein
MKTPSVDMNLEPLANRILDCLRVKFGIWQFGECTPRQRRDEVNEICKIIDAYVSQEIQIHVLPDIGQPLFVSAGMPCVGEHDDQQTMGAAQ